MARAWLVLAVAAVLAGVVAAPAHAARTTIGSDLAAAATDARGAPNDIVFWPAAAGPSAPAGVDVPVKGQAIIMRLKGGTQQPLGPASDPSFDIVHFQVLRPAGSSWSVVETSEDYRAPVIGQGADANTVTEFFPSGLCVQPGDRISMSTVGGYDARTLPGGLPYQTFAPTAGAATFTYASRADGDVGNGSTLPDQATRREDGLELLLQVVVGSNTQARPFCGGTATRPDPGAAPDTPDSGGGTGGGGGAGGGGGGGGTSPLRPKTTASLKTRRLGKDGRVKVPLSCRKAGTTCKGRITLRARRKAIGSVAYKLAPGETKTFRVKLTARGRGYLRAADGALRTALTLTTKGGIAKGGIFRLKPRSG